MDIVHPMVIQMLKVVHVGKLIMGRLKWYLEFGTYWEESGSG